MTRWNMHVLASVVTAAALAPKAAAFMPEGSVDRVGALYKSVRTIMKPAAVAGENSTNAVGERELFGPAPLLTTKCFTECIEQNLSPEDCQAYIEEQISEAGGHEVGDVTIKIQVPRTPTVLSNTYWMVEVPVNVNGQFTCDRNNGETYYPFEWTTPGGDDLAVANVDCQGMSAGECCVALRQYGQGTLGGQDVNGNCLACFAHAEPVIPAIGLSGNTEYLEYVYSGSSCDQVQMTEDDLNASDAVQESVIASATADLEAFAQAPTCNDFEGLLESLYDAAAAIKPLSQTIGELACTYCYGPDSADVTSLGPDSPLIVLLLELLAQPVASSAENCIIIYTNEEGDIVDVPKLGGSRADDPYDDDCPDLCGETGIFVDGVCVDCPEGEFNEGNNECVPKLTQNDCPVGSGLTSAFRPTCEVCPPGEFENGGLCEPCEMGTFSGPEGGNTECTRCAPGSVSMTAGQSECVVCGPGFVEWDYVKCEVCEGGTYQEGLNECVSCPAGRYQPDEAQTTCLDCPAGSMQPLEGQTSCMECPDNFVQPAVGQPTCVACGEGEIDDGETCVPDPALVPCPAGTIKFPTVYDCTACKAGEFETGGVCETCPAGTASAEGSDNCVPCGERLVSEAGAETCTACVDGEIEVDNKCVLCEAGSTQSGADNVCVPCAAGSYQAQPGKVLCRFCAPGTFQELTGQTKCEVCPDNFIQPNEGQAACDACPEGSFEKTGEEVCVDDPEDNRCPGGEEVGLTECKDCVAGDYELDGECTQCPEGTFSGAKATMCSSCPTGTVADAGASECKACDAGFVPVDKANCEPCEAGTFQDGLVCVDCPAGRFQPISGQDSCDDCAPGSFTIAPRQTQCTQCPEDSIQPDAGETFCTECPFGDIEADYETCVDDPLTNSCPAGSIEVPNSDDCVACPAGEIQVGLVCVVCEGGTYSMEGTTECMPCADGTVSQPGSGICDPCADGSISVDNMCKNCEPGTVQSGTGNVCVDCPVGTSQPMEGKATCVMCARGSVQPLEGQETCNQCEDDFVQVEVGQTECIACPEGAIEGENDTCVDDPDTNFCPEGQVDDPENFLECIPCPAGFFVDGVTCSKCAAGSFSNKGSSECTLCVAGTFSGAGAEECETCAEGAISAAGAATCTDCADGSVEVDNTTCEPCPAGTSQSGEDNTCIPCDDRFISAAGAASCTECAAGSISSANNEVCEDCAAGTVQTGTSNECSPCPAGQFQQSPGQETCDACPPGSFQAGEGAKMCKMCEMGSIQPASGQTECQVCPDGSLEREDETCVDDPEDNRCPGGEEVGLTECRDCVAGFYELDGVCTECPAGTFSGAKATVCSPCEMGTVSDAASSECSPCAAGFVPVDSKTCDPCAPGSAEIDDVCVPCSAGQYQPEGEQAECLDCAPGSVQPLTGQTECDECPVNSVQPLAGKTTCDQCEDGDIDEGEICVDDPDTNSCQDGFVEDALDPDVCVPCPAGSFQEGGALECSLCPAGTFSSQGSATCTDCAAGSVSEAGAETCTPCEGGSIEKDDSNTCEKCPAGTFEEDNKCVDCAKGSFQPKEGKQSCRECDSGTVQPLTGQPQCDACPENSVQPNMGEEQCIECQEFDVEGPNETCVDDPDTNRCPAGKIEGPGMGQCSDCPAGKFQDGVVCSVCPAGTFSLKGSFECTECQEGSISEGGAGSCTACEDGFVEVNHETCEICPPGTCKAGDLNECVPCFAGSFQPNAGQAVCLLCLKGTANPLTGQVACEACGEGFIAPSRGLLECEACPEGTQDTEKETCIEKVPDLLPCQDGTVRSAISDECIACTPGKFEENDVCVDCPAGTFSGVAAAVCLPCAEGTVSASGSASCSSCMDGSIEVGRTVCEECPAGSSQAGDLNECVLCAPGLYQPDAGQGACLQCSAGSVAPNEGATSCEQCETDFVQPAKGQTACEQCPAGTVEGTGQTCVQNICPPGLFPNEDGKCLACPAGAYEDAGECVDCPAGTFSGIASSECTTCPVRSVSQAGQASCTPCLPGEVEVGNVECVPCAAGSCQPPDGTPDGENICRPCPVGTVQPLEGKNYCIQCEKGQVQPLQGQVVCNDCQPGFVAPDYGLTQCLQCPVGTQEGSKEKCVSPPDSDSGPDGCYTPPASTPSTTLGEFDPSVKEASCTSSFTDETEQNPSIGGYSVTYMSSPYNAVSDSTTFLYNVCNVDTGCQDRRRNKRVLQGGKNGLKAAISHVTIELFGNCAVTGFNMVDESSSGSDFGAAPYAYDVGKDPTTCVPGFKWDSGFSIDEDGGSACVSGDYCRDLTVTIAGKVPTTSGDAVIKAAKYYLKFPNTPVPDCANVC